MVSYSSFIFLFLSRILYVLLAGTSLYSFSKMLDRDYSGTGDLPERDFTENWVVEWSLLVLLVFFLPMDILRVYRISSKLVS